MAARLIVSADDFGHSASVNSAVVSAYRHGVLTSSGLMVTRPAAAEAVSMAKDEPGLAVGLHLTLSDGCSALAARTVPDLVDKDARFAENPAKAALGYYFGRRARLQLRDEIEAQFERFSAMGLRMSHVDGHQHLHAHPSALPTVIRQAKLHGARGIRVPRDPLWANLLADRSGAVGKILVALGHAYLAHTCRAMLRDSGLCYCNTVIGSLMSGRMTPSYVGRMLDADLEGPIELFFHPAKSETGIGLGPNPEDLRTLLDPTVKELIRMRDYRLSTYEDLQREVECDLD